MGMIPAAKRCAECDELIKHEDSFCHNCLHPHEKYPGEPSRVKNLHDYAT